MSNLSYVEIIYMTEETEMQDFYKTVAEFRYSAKHMKKKVGTSCLRKQKPQIVTEA